MKSLINYINYDHTVVKLTKSLYIFFSCDCWPHLEWKIVALYNWPGAVLRWCHSDCQSCQEKNSDKEEHSKACAGTNSDSSTEEVQGTLRNRRSRSRETLESIELFRVDNMKRE